MKPSHSGWTARDRHVGPGGSGWEAPGERLRRAPVPVRDSAPSPGGPRWTAVKDPGGHVLELPDAD